MVPLLVNAATPIPQARAAEAGDRQPPARPDSRPNPPREFTDLNDHLVRLQHLLADLTAETASLTAEAHEALFAGVPLEGSWRLTLPAGFEEPVEIRSAPGDRLQLNVRGVMRGTYRREGHVLRMETPADKRLTEFVWAFVGVDRLMLVESPPVAKIGSDYRGATLDRVQRLSQR